MAEAMDVDTEIKSEPVDAVDLENKILQLCGEYKKGVSDAMIMTSAPQFTPGQRVTAINRLLSTHQIELLKSGNQLMYRLRDAESSSRMKGADNQEKLIYQIIEDAGNKGIWTRDIRYKSNLLLTQVNKILKSLESKKLIKAVKSVAASKKKVYMLFNLEPDRSVTGGAWYSDQDFESEFVGVLNQQCMKFLEQKAAAAQESKPDPIGQRNASYASSREIWQYISQLKISKIELSMDDIEMILNTLIFDGKVELTFLASVVAGESDQKLYRAVQSYVTVSALMRTPCGVCPVYTQCHEAGEISPTNCVYMSEWLSM